MAPRNTLLWFGAVLALSWVVSPAAAQVVGLPAPRLLTVMPMGGQVGTSVEVRVTGENIDEGQELLFSNPKITAQPKPAADGQAQPGKFLVCIAADAPLGVHEARLMTRLGISASRAFSVGAMPELTRDKPNTTAATALALAPGVVYNAAVSAKAVDFYTLRASRGQRLIVDCAAPGIDSKLTAALALADSAGQDLLVNRRGGSIDFTAPADGDYLVKVSDLAYQGGETYFYRLALLEAPPGAPAPRQPSTRPVSAASYTPPERSDAPEIAEVEPNDRPDQAQPIVPPCQIAGRFFPEADVDLFQFAAKQSDVWWVEVVSERLGLPTDPFLLVERVVQEAGGEKPVDVAELNDIPSPVALAPVGLTPYAGVLYNAGSTDLLGKLEIPADGLYRLQLRDLFGGTRRDPDSAYRLILRRPVPDFALVAWPIQIECRNQDRSALSRPIALRRGGTMALEVAALRQDGFDGAIELALEDLPEGVSAAGLTIPPGTNRGTILITSADGAPRSATTARMFGRGEIGGAAVSRPCQLASMIWPVRETELEFPAARLLADVVVSVGAEDAPLTIAPSQDKVWQAQAGEKLTIPLNFTWRGEFTSPLRLKPRGAGFEGANEISVPLGGKTAQAQLDLAALKVAPGDYTLAYYGSYTTKYRPQSAAAAPTLTADMVVSAPIRISVAPAAGK